MPFKARLIERIEMTPQLLKNIDTAVGCLRYINYSAASSTGYRAGAIRRSKTGMRRWLAIKKTCNVAKWIWIEKPAS